MKNKIYISIFLWLSFSLVIISYFIKNTEKQNQALKETQETVLKSHKKMYNDKFNSMELYINGLGNNPRDRVVQKKIRTGEGLLDSMFVKGKIENKSILPFLRTHYYSMGEVNDTEKILQELEEYKGSNEMIKQVNFLDRYQTSFYYLYEHHKEIGGVCMRITTTNLVNASDTILGFEFDGLYDDYIIESQKKVRWVMDSLNNLALISVETYIKEDTVRKMYKVTSPKNSKPDHFDYEEIEH